MAISVVAGLASVAGAALAGVSMNFLVGLGYFALGAGMSLASRALAPRPNLGARMRGIQQTTRQPASSRKMVYGRMRVGGQVVFIGNSGEDNAYLHLVVAFASHEIESFERLYFNEDDVWSSSGGVDTQWTDVLNVYTHDGTQTIADANLVNDVTEWTNNHKLLGIAYVHFKMKWDADKFPNGVPNITAELKGKKVYDPRTSTTAYSDNPALCLRDYLTNSYGLDEDTALIDDTAITTAANICDQDVDILPSGTQTRYRCNGQIDTGNQIKANIEHLLGSFGGTLTFTGGKFIVKAATYVAPQVTFTEADFVSEIQTQTKQSRRTQYNTVKGIFVSSEENWKVVDYPAQTLKTNAGSFSTGETYEILFVGNTDFTAIGASSNTVGVQFTATGAGSGTGYASKSIVDDGAKLDLDMPLPFVTHQQQAQRLAKITLNKSRQQVALTASVNLKGLLVQIGDNVYIDNTRLGYDGKAFEVVDYALRIDAGGVAAVDLQLVETASAVYDWTTDDEEDFLSGGEVDLDDGKTVPQVTNMAITEVGLVGPDGGLLSSVRLTWDLPTYAFIGDIFVRWKKSTDSTYAQFVSVGPEATEYFIQGLDITYDYDFAVQVSNLIGVHSDLTLLEDQELNGDETAPALPTNVTLTAGINVITCEWTNPSDIDLAHVEVHVTTGSTTPAVDALPTAKISGEEYIAVGLSTDTRYFHLRSVDYSGNKSGYTSPVNTTSLNVTESDLDPSIVTGIEVVSTLPSSGYEGQVVYLTTDEKLYRYNGSDWTVAVDGTDITANSITGGKIEAGAIGTSLLAVGAIGGTVVTGDKIYHGSGIFNNANTPFYLDDDGDFSLKNKLSFDSSTAELVVDGTVRADILDLVGGTIAGNFVANNIADGSVFADSLTEDAVAEIEDRLFTITPSFNFSNGASFTPSNGLNSLIAPTSGTYTHVAGKDVRFEFIFNAAWDSWGVQYTFGTNDENATVKFEHKKSGLSTWTTVHTATITASKTDTPDGHVFTVNERETYTLTGLAAGNYQFRVTVQSQTTGVNYWSLAEPEVQTFYFNLYEVDTRGLTLTDTLTASNGLVANGLTYPTTDGTNGQVITTDGSGNLSFSDATGSDGDITAVIAGLYLSGGATSGDATLALDVGSSGNWWNSALSVDLSGVVEAGRYIDWHYTSSSTVDYNARSEITSTGVLRHTTAYGYIDLGPNNSSYAHISTDRSRFYFNKRIIVDEGIILSYNEDLQLGAGYGGSTSITIDHADNEVTFNQHINIAASKVIKHNTTEARDKIRLWNNSTYAIGFDSGYTYGHLSSYAMTFQMSNTDDRGWIFLDSAHTDAQGAMSLTTIGEMTVASSLSVGEGQSITSPQSDVLYVKGNPNFAVMPTFETPGKIIISRGDNIDREHEMRFDNSSLASDNYMKFAVHNGTVGSMTEVLGLWGDNRAQVFGAAVIGDTSALASSFNANASRLIVGDGVGAEGLTIYSGATSNGSIHFGDAATTGADSYSGHIVYNHSTNKMALGTNGNNQVYIDSGGDVGIGVASPSYKLDLIGTIRIQDDGQTGYVHSRIITESDASGRGSGLYMHNYASDTEWYIGRPYSSADNFVIARQSTANHADSTAQLSNSYFVISSSGNVGINRENPNYKLHVNGAVNFDHSEHMGFRTSVTDGTCNQTFYGHYFDVNMSGADACTADRNHAALYIDLDSSATGGDTSNEHRVYGVYSDVRVTGDSDLVYAAYNYARTDHSSGTIGTLRGATNSGMAHNSSGTMSNVYGAFNIAYDFTSGTGTATSMYGSQNLAIAYSTSPNGASSFFGAYNMAQATGTQSQNISQLIGTYSEVQIDGNANTFTISNAYVVRAEYDYNDGDDSVTVSTGYLYYGNYAGTLPNNAYGVYILSEVKNYFRGTVAIGTSNSAHTNLEINTPNRLGSSFTGTTDGEGLAVNQDNYVAGNYVSLVEGSYITSVRNPNVRIGAKYTGSGSSLVFGTSNNYSAGITNTALTIDYLGQVGIGTESPSSMHSAAQTLVVGGGDGNTGVTVYSGTSSYGSIHFADGTSGSQAYHGYIWYSHSLAEMGFGTNGTEQMRIESDGRIAVNTTNAQAMIDAKADSAYTPSFYARNDGSASSWARMDWYNNQVAGAGIVYRDQNGTFAFRNDNSSGTATETAIVAGNATHGNIGFYSNVSKRVALIDTGGNFYVGRGVIGENPLLRVYYGEDPMDLYGFGIQFHRTSNYLRPTVDGTKTLYIGGADASQDWSSIHFRSVNGLYMTGTQFLTSGRNLVNIGNITASGEVDCDSVDCNSVDCNGNVGALSFAIGLTTVIDAFQQIRAGTSTAQHELQGNTYIGQTLDVRINSSSSTGIMETEATNMILRCSGGGSIRFYMGSGGFGSTTYERMYLNQSGSLYIDGTYNTYSDQRLKNNIKPIKNALEKVEALNGVTFNHKESGDASTGLIAQDVEKVLPEAVAEAENGYLTVQYGNTVGLLVEAIKELKKEVEDLKSQLEEKNGDH